MAGFFEDLAAGAADIGGKLAQGVGDTIVDRTKVGSLIDPFFETSREKKNAPLLKEREEQIAFNKEQRTRTTEQQALGDEASEVKRQAISISANRDTATKNTQAMLGTVPEYNSLTDIDKNKVFASEPMQDLINFKTLSRIGVEAQSDPKKMGTFRRALNEQGMDLIEKDGKTYLNHPEDGAIELTDNNVVGILNGFQAEAAEEVKAYARFAAQDTDLKGQSFNNETQLIRAQYEAQSSGLGQPMNLSTAQKQLESFYKGNRFSPQQERVHYVNTGLTKILEDGNISASERQDVNTQLEMLGEAIGIKSRPTVDGGIEVQSPGDQGWYPLQAFYKSLQAPGADEIADRFKAQFGGGAAPTPFEAEVNELTTDLPEENREAVAKAIAPLMEETGIDSKERKAFASAISDMVDFSSVEGDQEKLYLQVKALANEKDISEDKLYDLLPEGIKLPVGMQIAKEAQAEQKKALKRAMEQQKTQKLWLRRFKKHAEIGIEAQRTMHF